jgi:hypothetical protein
VFTAGFRKIFLQQRVTSPCVARAIPTGGGASVVPVQRAKEQAFASHARCHPQFYWIFFETRATNSSNLESNSFKMGDLFDFL